MRDQAFQKLLDINKEFYQSFGQAFAQTRRRIQPGVRRVLDEWVRDGDWLDIGCGSGALAQAWRRAGLSGTYTGVDFSTPLLAEAETLAQKEPPAPNLRVSYRQADLAAEDWTDGLENGAFDGALAFAVLHHIPSMSFRQALLRRIARLLKHGGLFIHSEWQFQNSPRLLARVLPWQTAGIDERELEEGDRLLDWRYQAGGAQEKPGLRYVHLFNREELQGLADSRGFEILEEFESDGREGRLALYQVWRLKS